MPVHNAFDPGQLGVNQAVNGRINAGFIFAFSLINQMLCFQSQIDQDKVIWLQTAFGYVALGDDKTLLATLGHKAVSAAERKIAWPAARGSFP